MRVKSRGCSNVIVVGNGAIARRGGHFRGQSQSAITQLTKKCSSKASMEAMT